jgi:hypothetical protein
MTSPTHDRAARAFVWSVCLVMTLACALALVACGGKPSPPTVAPEAIARLRDLVFADQDLDEVVKLQPPVDDPSSPWPRLASAARLRSEDPEAAAAELEQVLTLPALETRVQLWTWTALRGLGVAPDAASADVVQGLVVETPAGDGADTLAVFRDGTVRWFDHAGKAAFWDVHAAADREMADLVHAPIALTERIDVEERGALTHPRPARRPDAVRVSVLSFRGVRCREATPDALRKDERLSAVVTAGGAIARKLAAAR